VLGWCEADRPLVEVPPAQPDDRDRAWSRGALGVLETPDAPEGGGGHDMAAHDK
jgi:hypothetical protein